MANNMKTFTTQDFSQRIAKAFLKRSGLRTSLDDTVVINLIDAVSEQLAEAVRYDEFLTRDKSWTYARTSNSIISQARPLGYEPQRKRSAIATLMFAHDENILNFGGYSDETYIEHEDELGAYDGYETAPGVIDYANLRSLRHYDNLESNARIDIPAGTIVGDTESDLVFMTLDSGSIYTRPTSANEALLSLSEDRDPDRDFTSRWARLAAIQGVRREHTAYGLPGREFERVVIDNKKVEDMNRPISFDHPTIAGLIVEVREQGADSFQEWSRVEDIREAGPYDRVFSIETALDYSNVSIIFGNNYSGRKIAKGSDVRVRYLETEGRDGNVEGIHRLTDIRNITNVQVPNGVNLYVTNLSAVVNGADEDTVTDIKRKAPRRYLEVDSVGSDEAYTAVIENLPSIRRAKVFRGVYRNNQEGVERDTVSFTALTESGENPDTAAIERDVRRAIGRRRSPTDIIQYEPPERVLITYNVQGFVDDVTRPLQYFVDEIKRVLYEEYQIQQLDFKQPIYHIDVVTLLRTQIQALRQAQAFPEARIQKKFYETEFIENEEGTLQLDFRFNPALAPFKEIRNNVEHILRVDFVCPYTPIRHRSRTLLVIPNPDIQDPDDPEFIVRQFNLLTGIVLTPERVRAILSDTFGTYGEKTDATWHWINRRELEEIPLDEYDSSDEDQTLSYNRDSGSIELNSALSDYLDDYAASTWRVIEVIPEDEEEEPIVYLFFTDVVDISESNMTESEVFDYYDAHGDWQERTWANDPDVKPLLRKNDILGELPGAFAPDENIQAPVEVSFLPRATEGMQAGTGTIYIRPSLGGMPIFTAPKDEYRDASENSTPRPSWVEIFAAPRANDLRLDDSFSIFDLEKSFIRADLRYRTEFDSEFQTAYTLEDEDEDEDS